jgi:hypothetical protein
MTCGEQQHPLTQRACAIPLETTPETPCDISRALAKASTSWLRGNDIAKLLEDGAAGNLPLSTAAADAPPGGTLFLFDRRRTRFFRMDGHNWRKKSDGKTTKETHEKLKVDNVERLNCYYAHAVEPFHLQRRCYWLLENDRVVLVHYLQADSGRRSEGRWNELLQQGLATGEVGPDGCPAMPSPSNTGAYDGLAKRRRSSAESSRFSDGAESTGYYSQAGNQRMSIDEELSRSRLSSFDESLDSFHVVGRRSSTAGSTLPPAAKRFWGFTGGRSNPAMPATSAVPPLPWDTAAPGPLPWEVPAVAPRAQEFEQQLPFIDYNVNVECAMAGQGSNRPSMDGFSAPCHPDSTGACFFARELSRDVVSCFGGDKVLIVGTPSSEIALAGGVYVEVDGALCETRLIQSGVISFMTQPHAPGQARLIIRNSFGQVISSNICLTFT